MSQTKLPIRFEWQGPAPSVYPDRVLVPISTPGTGTAGPNSVTTATATDFAAGRGFLSDGDSVVPLTFGSGLTLVGTTLSATATGGTWGTITGTLADQTDLNAALGLKAPLASPTFTGNVGVPTRSAGDNTANAASTAFVGTAVSALSTVYQPFNSNLTSWAAIARAAGFDTFAATPTSANLRTLLTDETGTGAAVFADTPTFTTKILVPTGSVAAPGIAFSSVTNIGFILIGAFNGFDAVLDGASGVRFDYDGGRRGLSFVQDNGRLCWFTGGSASAAHLRRSATRVIAVGGSSDTDPGTFSSIPLTPAQITADQSNWNPGTARTIRYSTDATRTFHGIVAGVDGQEVALWNIGTFPMVLKHESGTGTAANRVQCPDATDMTLAPTSVVVLKYSAGAVNRWVVESVLNTAMRARDRLGYVALSTLGTTGAVVINCAARNITHVLSLTGNVTLSLTNEEDGARFTLLVRGQASGYTITWWAGVKWSGGAAPTIPTTSGRVLPLYFLRLASGEWLGSVGQEHY